MSAFELVASEGSFTKAADRLDTSPQLVSKYVGQLEQRLNARLLNRTTRKVSLTEAGSRYFQWVQQVLQDIDEMESQIGDMQEEAQGQLRISAPVSFAIQHMGSLVTEFQQAHPGVSIDLQLNDRKVDIVEEGFDIALRIGHLKSSSLIAKQIAPIRLAMCASPEYLKRHGTPEKPEDLKKHRYLRYSYMENETSFAVNQWLKIPGRDSSGDLICNNGDLLVKAAIEGAGIAIQPTFISGQAIAKGQLQRLLPELEPEPMGLYAVYAHRKLLASKVRCFLDFIDGYFGTPRHGDAFDCDD